jgi:type I restriction enzyme S subunit
MHTKPLFYQHERGGGMELRPGYKMTEVGVIPEDWEVKHFGQTASIERGKFTARPRNDPKLYGGNIPFIQTGDVTRSGGRITSFTQTLNDAGLQVSKLFPKETLFFTIAANIGDVGIAEFEAACPDSLVAIAPNNGIDKIWLLYELKKRKADFENIASPGAQLNINLEKLRPYLLPYPPLPEQRAIATALSDVDTLLAALDQLIAKKRDLKQAAMQQLLTGKTRLPGFSGAWEVKRLGDVASFFKGKGLPKNAISESGTEPCIHYGELFTRYPETIGEICSRTDSFAGAFRSVGNDVLMPTSDVTPRGLAKASCITSDDVILGGDILVIRSDTALVNGSFLSFIIRYEEDNILKLVTGSTVYHLYGTDMEGFTFSIPSLREQVAIVEFLSAINAELSALEARRDKTRHLKQAMMQELLTGKTRLVVSDKTQPVEEKAL